MISESKDDVKIQYNAEYNNSIDELDVVVDYIKYNNINVTSSPNDSRVIDISNYLSVSKEKPDSKVSVVIDNSNKISDDNVVNAQDFYHNIEERGIKIKVCDSVGIIKIESKSKDPNIFETECYKKPKFTFLTADLKEGDDLIVHSLKSTEDDGHWLVKDKNVCLFTNKNPITGEEPSYKHLIHINNVSDNIDSLVNDIFGEVVICRQVNNGDEHFTEYEAVLKENKDYLGIYSKNSHETERTGNSHPKEGFYSPYNNNEFFKLDQKLLYSDCRIYVNKNCASVKKFCLFLCNNFNHKPLLKDISEMKVLSIEDCDNDDIPLYALRCINSNGRLNIVYLDNLNVKVVTSDSDTIETTILKFKTTKEFYIWIKIIQINLLNNK